MSYLHARRAHVKLVAIAALLLVGLTVVSAPGVVNAQGACTPWQTQYKELTDPTRADQIITSRHRGAFNNVLPENSMGAFGNAFVECRPAVETDVRLTGDGVPVLFHDTHLGKMLEPEYNPETDEGPNAALNQTTWQELRSKKLLKPDRTPTHYTVPSVDELMEYVLAGNVNSMVHLEVKDQPALIPTAKILYDYQKKYPNAQILKRVILKFPMHWYTTPDRWHSALKTAGIDEKYTVMPKINPRTAQGIDTSPPIPDRTPYELDSNAARSVAAWAQADSTEVPVIEVNVKDAEEFVHTVHHTDSRFGEYDAPVDVTVENTEPGTMAQFAALVHAYDKRLGAYVPVPDAVLFSPNPEAGYTVANTRGDKQPIPITQAFYRANSSCCYKIEDVLSPSKYAAEKHDWRINRDFLHSLGVSMMTSDDTDSIELYAKHNGYLNTIARSEVIPPPDDMKSVLYSLLEGEGVPNNALVNIQGWDGEPASDWGGKVCLWNYPGWYLWTVRCDHYDESYTNVLRISTIGGSKMQISDPHTDQCLGTHKDDYDRVYWMDDCDDPRTHWRRTPQHRLQDIDGREINFSWQDRYSYGSPFAYNYLTEGDTSTWSIWKFVSAGHN